jgi:hypothetical protein
VVTSLVQSKSVKISMEKLYLSPVGVFLIFFPFEFAGSELLLISSLIFMFIGFMRILPSAVVSLYLWDRVSPAFPMCR